MSSNRPSKKASASTKRLVESLPMHTIGNILRRSYGFRRDIMRISKEEKPKRMRYAVTQQQADSMDID
jgi:hypothetical protein